MDETSSHIRPAESAPAGEGALRPEDPTSHRTSPPVAIDPPTVITGRSPIPSPDASDSAFRILQGLVVPGDRMGHFELLDYVGGGGMGRVFRAMDTQLARIVALKIMPPEQAADSDSLQRFQNEAQSAARLDHENIARVYCIGEDRGLHFIVFEYIEGVNIRALVERKGALPLGEAVSYTLQVAEALSHSDTRAVVHRDIKPSNLLITPEGRVKLIDMGLARLRLVDPEVADLTASGVTLGTFDYISPEQARDPRNADIRSDIYSLGCTVFFMLTGQPPFPEGTVLQKLLQHQGDQPPDIRQFRTDLPDEVGRILQKMMAKDPRHRYASPVDLVGELITLAEQIGLRPISSSSKVWLPQQKTHISFFRRHLPWMVPIAALVGAVVLLDLYWSSSAQHDGASQPQYANWLAETSPTQVNSKDAVRNNPASVPAVPTIPTPAETPTSPASVSPTPPAGSDPPPGEPKPKRPWGSKNDLKKWPATKAPEKKRTPTPGASQSASLASAVQGAPPLVPPAGEYDKNNPPVVAPEGKLPLGDGSLASPGPTPTSETPSRGLNGGVQGRQVDNGNIPTISGTAPLTKPKPSGVLVVGERTEGENEYATLAAACAAARDGDVIELRYNGPRQESPIKIPKLQAMIRAGDGYQPVIVFRPTEVDPVKHPRSMLTLASGRLTLVNLAIELEVPRQVAADTWSLFDIRGGQTVRIERCSFSIRNASDQLTAYHSDVAFFRAMSATESEGTVSVAPLATLELTDCVARGEAVFLRVEDLQPVHLSWDNGLLLTTERLLWAAGGQSPPKPDEMLRVDLHHITAVTQSGLCRLTSSPTDPYQLTAQFSCTNCVFVGSPAVAMIEQERAANSENARQHIVWNGNSNYYENIDVFWAIRGPDFETSPSTLNFDGWKAHWTPFREYQPSIERLTWQNTPPVNQALHTHTPADYTLANPTANDDTDENTGVCVMRLPLLPAETEKPGTRSGDAGRRKQGLDQRHQVWPEKLADHSTSPGVSSSPVPTSSGD